MKLIKSNVLIYFSVALLTVGLLITVNSLNIKTRTRLASKGTNMNMFGNGTAPAGNSTSANKTDVFYGPIDPAKVIKKAPWVVTDCNNTLNIQAQSLVDLTLREDYIKKEPKYFVMDERYVRKYKDDKATCPEIVVEMAFMTVVPQILPGSVTCIQFISTRNETDSQMSMCLKDKNEVEEILRAYSNFQICRMGGNLEKYNPLVVDELVKGMCLDVPTKHREDERDPFNDYTKDKNGKIKPRVNVAALKDFFKTQLSEAGVSHFN